MNLLPFEAGSYSSDEEEVEYLDTDLDGRLISGVQLKASEEDYDATETTDDKPGQAYTNPQSMLEIWPMNQMKQNPHRKQP